MHILNFNTPCVWTMLLEERHHLFSYLRQSNLGWLVPFVRSSLPVVWTRYFTNEWTGFCGKFAQMVDGAWSGQLRGQEVKCQGHRRPKLDLDAWRRASFSTTSQLVAVCQLLIKIMMMMMMMMMMTRFSNLFLFVITTDVILSVCFTNVTRRPVKLSRIWNVTPVGVVISPATDVSAWSW